MPIPKSDWVIPTPDDIILCRKNDIARRIHSLVKVYHKWFDEWKSWLFLSHHVLTSCIESYYIDIERLKGLHHNSKWADSHKRAGFTMKWISHLRPVQITSYTGSISTADRKIILTANDFYVFWSGMSFLNVNSTQLTDDMIKNCVYSLRYRPISGELLSTQAYLIECAANGAMP